MEKIFNTVDFAINQLNKLTADSISKLSESELLERLVDKKNWFENDFYLECIKKEILNLMKN